MNEEKTEKVAPNIKYEFDMLEWSYIKVTNSNKKGNEHNSYIECFLLHVRNLIDFFVEPNHSQSDDVLAQHFFENPSIWIEKEMNICSFVQSERSEINKTLAHLTYKRTTQKQWNLVKLHNELQDAKSEFLALLTDKQKKWFK